MTKWTQSLIDADDAMLREALELTHIPALLAVLVHFKGSTDHFEQVQPPWHTSPARKQSKR